MEVKLHCPRARVALIEELKTQENGFSTLNSIAVDIYSFE